MPPKQRTLAPGSSDQSHPQRTGRELAGPNRSFTSVELPSRARTSHACDRCRELRAKCSGGARCAKCTRDDASCVYGDRKRERTKKNLARNAEHIEELEDQRRVLLSTLINLANSPNFDKERHADAVDLIDHMSRMGDSSLSHYGSYTQSQSQSQSHSSASAPTDLTDETLSPKGENRVKSDVGSPGHQAELSSVVDLNHGSGLAGYVGKMAGSSWAMRVRDHLLGDLLSQSTPNIVTRHMNEGLESSNVSYFMEDQNLLAVDEDYVNGYQMPPWSSALILTEAYFHSLQGAFRFVQRDRFLLDLKEMYETAGVVSLPQLEHRHFLALANVMWATGAKWLELAGLSEQIMWDSDQAPISEGHLVYYARARSLGLDHRVQLDHPTMTMVQGLGVLSLYLLVNGSIHRAWGLVGQSIRHAVALGLHLKVSGKISDQDRVRRVQTWFSLFRMEILLSEMTGRPKCVSSTITTVPNPIVVLEDEEAGVAISGNMDDAGDDLGSQKMWREFLGPNQDVTKKLAGGIINWQQIGPVGHHNLKKQFAVVLRLITLSDKISSSIFLSTSDLTWAEVQRTVQTYEDELESWSIDLIDGLKFDRIGWHGVDVRAALDLEFYRCSIKMILYRPFLCEIRILDESEDSVKYNQTCARNGVYAAMRLVNLLPDNPRPELAVQVLPWWILLHYVNQAASILLLELCLNVQHMQDESQDLLSATKKALGHIWAFTSVSKSAVKAYAILRLLFGKIVPRFRSNLSDLPTDAPRPPNWDLADEMALQKTLVETLEGQFTM